MKTLNDKITQKGKRMDQNTTFISKSPNNASSLITMNFLFLRQEVHKSDTVQIQFSDKYTSDISTGHNIFCTLVDADSTVGTSYSVLCEMTASRVLEVSIAESKISSSFT
jgi:hypothetical protein